MRKLPGSIRQACLLSILSFVCNASINAQTVRWANQVFAFSSQYSSFSWSAAQVVAAPNVYPSCGDIASAWASSSPDASREFLELGFPSPAPVNKIEIYETLAPGAIDSVFVFNPNTSSYQIVWSATATAAACPRILTIRFPVTSFDVSRIRIAINSPAVGNWNEIDAVGISMVNDGGTVSGNQSTCANQTPNIITSVDAAFSGAAGVVYQWQQSAGNNLWSDIANTNTASYAPPAITTTTFYRRKATLGSESTYSNMITITVADIGDPSVFPVNKWHQYGYSGRNIDLVGITYRGYDTINTVDFNTFTHWTNLASPSAAASWKGCTIPVDNFTAVFKRKGFPSDLNSIRLPVHDDEVRIYKNGRVVFNAGCCSSNTLVALGKLGADSTIEIRLGEGGGGSQLIANFFNTPLNPGSIGGAQSVCLPYTTATLTNVQTANFGNAPLSIQYQWQDSVAGGEWRIIPGAVNLSYTPATLVTTTWFRRQATDSDGGSAFSNIVSVTTGIPAGDPAISPDNAWNFYAYNGRNIELTGLRYHGFYSRNTLSFSTDAHWNTSASPSAASGYQGCGVGIDNFTLVAKRRGFTPDNYVLNIPSHDDEVRVYVNNVKVFEHFACCDGHTNISLGALNDTSVVEIRLGEASGGSILNVQFFTSPLVPGTISSSQVLCSGENPQGFTNTISAYGGASPSTITYQWQDSVVGGNWQNIAAAVNATYASPPLTKNTWFRRNALDSKNGFATSNVAAITVIPKVGDTAVYGNNKWHFYTYNGNNIDLLNAAYRGFYSDTSLKINTPLSWNQTASPSAAAGYQGCPVNIDNFVVSAKRKGFPRGSYSLSFPSHDDAVKVFLNGVLIGQAVCCNTNLVINGVVLNENSSLEIRFNEFTSTSYLVANFTNTTRNQTITFDPVPAKTYGDAPFIVHATATSGLPVTYSLFSGPASMNNDTVTILGAGTITVRATQPGNDTLDAVSDDLIVTVNKAAAAITLSNLSHVYNGQIKTPSATTSPAGLVVNYLFNGSSSAVNAGAYQVVASITNANYSGSVTDSFFIQKAAQTISLTPIPDKEYGADAFPIVASASSGLPVSITVTTEPASGVIFLSGTTIFPQGAGDVFIKLTQAGNGNYLPAADVKDSFTIAPPYAKDIEVRSLQGLSTGCSLPVAKEITARLYNAGTDTLSGFAITYVLNNLVITETINTLIYPKTQFDYSFTTKADLSATQTHSFTVYTSLTGDERKTNDTIKRQIVNYAPAAMGVSPSITICKGKQASLSAFGGVGYSWSNGSASNIIQVSPVSSSVYYVSITDNNGCIKQDSVKVDVLPELVTPVITASGTAVVCSGETVLLTTNIDENLSWYRSVNSGSVLVSTSKTFHASISGSYFVKYKNAAGCESVSQLFPVTVLPKPVVKATPAPSVCVGDSVVLFVENGAAWTWSTGEQTASIKVSPSDTTEYFVSGTNSAGCSYNDSIIVNVLPGLPPGMAGNLFPDNNTINLDLPVQLSWLPGVNTAFYDIYIWKNGEVKPAVPTVANTQSIVYQPSGLQFAQTYNWQIIFRNSCFQTAGPVYNFTLAQQPDLIVNNREAPDNVNAGGKITVKWEIKNNGAGSTKDKKWKDHIFLSEDVNLENYISLGAFDNQSYLQPGQSYIQTKEVQIPRDYTGVYYLFVVTDNGNTVAESIELNNSKFAPLTITLPPLPDLAVKSVGAPTDAFSNDSITIQYQVRNEGTAHAVGDLISSGNCTVNNLTVTIKEHYWKDAVYISSDPVFNSGTAKLLGEASILLSRAKPGGNAGCIIRGDTLRMDSVYNQSLRVKIPYEYNGTYYLYVVTNTNGLFEPYLLNNVLRTEPILVRLTPPADLVVENITTPVSANSGEQLSVSFKVGNHGANAPVPNSWKDKVYLSDQPVFNVAQSILLSAETYSQTSANPLVNNNTYTVSKAYSIPKGIIGSYYVYVYTDADNQVFEFNQEGNNIRRSTQPVQIIYGNRPDLIVTQIMLPDSITRERPFPASWIIKNKGSKRADASWTDQIYWSPEKTFNTSSAKAIGSFQHNSSLDTGGTRTINVIVNLPAHAPDSITFFIRTDHTDLLFEISDSNNTSSHHELNTRTPVLKHLPVILKNYIDLYVNSITTGSAAFSGEEVVVSYTIKNLSAQTSTASWTDWLFFSSDSILDNSDIFIGGAAKTSIGALESYTRTVTVKIPDGISGIKYFLVKTDGQNAAPDTIRTNNFKAHAFNVTGSTYSDLIVSELQAPVQVYAGQSLKIPFKVVNQGAGNTKGSWYDGAYLSTTPFITQASILIGSRLHDVALVAGGNYRDTLTVNIPPNLSGNYYVVVQADHFNRVYETTESNNHKETLTAIIIPLPADLTMTQLTLPDSTLLGDSVKASFSLKNIGTNAALTGFKDAVYISKDSSFNPLNDPLFGIAQNNSVIQPGETKSFEIRENIQSILPGDYFGIGRTNVTNTVPEVNINNNQKITDKTMAVNIRELLVNIPLQTPLQVGRNRYYKIDVAGDMDMVIDMTGNRENSHNQFYVAFGRVPTTNDFDAKGNLPQQASQRIVLPGTQAGTYYLLVRSTLESGVQQVTLLARVLPFSLLSVNPHRLGQGVVTTRIEGAGFRSGISYKLRKNSTGQDVASAMKIDRKNSMQATVVWDLVNVAEGNYDLIAVNADSSEVILVNGIEVEKPTGYQIDDFYTAPDVIRAGRNAFYSFTVKNTGNVDIPFVQTDIAFDSSVKVQRVSTAGNVKTREAMNPYGDTAHFEEFVTIENYKAIPLFTKNLVAGDEFNVSILLSNFVTSSLGVSFRADAYSREEYVSKHYSAIEMMRTIAVNDPQYFNDASLTQTAQNPGMFRDLLLVEYFKMGLLSPEDTIGIVAPCESCGLASVSEPGFTFSPGTSPGTLFVPDANFGQSQNYDWEINRYDGTAGKDPGWDLISASGALTVSATPDKRFTINVVSLDYLNKPGLLTGWYPAVDKCWPIAIAKGGISGFDTSKFSIDLKGFTAHNNIYGGKFSVRLKGTDTLLLCYTSYKPPIGFPGIPGAPGGRPGQPGSPGGKGGPGTGTIPPGPGGPGGAGGPGAPGGPGGTGGDGGPGGPGGTGGTGGQGGGTGPGGTGGTGGPGGTGGQGGDGGNGGAGGGGPGGGGSGCVRIVNAVCEKIAWVVGCGVTGYGCYTLYVSGGAKVGFAGGAAAFGVGALFGAAAGAAAGTVVATIVCGVGVKACAQQNLTIVGKIVRFFCRQVVRACDPNEIQGPPGYGAEKFVAKTETLPYTILYENDPEFATTAAQRVIIRQPISENADAASFKLNSFGFGKYLFDVPAGVSNYSTTLNLADSIGFNVQVTAGLDIVTREALWVFQSIDPLTGLPPSDPFAGYLAVNDSIGSGEGFVSYTIRPSRDAVTGDSISAQANIIFDINEPIVTNTALNIVDAAPPVSVIDPAAVVEYNKVITFTINAADDSSGSGVRDFRLYYSENGGAFQLYDSLFTAATISFAGEMGNSYGFFTVSTDNVGNEEEMKQVADITVVLKPAKMLELIEPTPAVNYCSGALVRLRWAATGLDSVNVYLTQENDSANTNSMLLTTIAAGDTLYHWTVPADLPSGNYVIRISDVADTSVHDLSALIMIHQPVKPEIVSSFGKTFCEGNATALSVGSGYTSVQWSTLETTNSISVNTSGIYGVQTTDINGCTANDSISIIVHQLPAQPVIEAGGDLSFCQGGSMILSAPAGFKNYLWSGGDTTRSISVNEPGNYTVSVKDDNGCQSATSEPANVIVYALPQKPVITANGSLEFCKGGSVVLSAPAGYTNYIWSSGDTTESITVNQSGDLFVSVKNENGCESPSSDPVHVTVNPLPQQPVISANGTLVFCNGGQVVLSAPAGYSYEWSTGATTQSISVDQSLDATVNIIDANGCRSIVSPTVSVTVNPLPVQPLVSVQGAVSFCEGGQAELSAPVGYTAYLWSDGSITSSVIVSQSGNFSIQVTDQNGCQSIPSQTQNITVHALPAKPLITADGSLAFCEGSNVTLSAPAGFAGYRWSSGETTEKITVNHAGNFSVSVTDGNGCESPASESVNTIVHALPVQPVITNMGPLAFCEGGQVILKAPSGYNKYLWSDGRVTESVTVNQSGVFTVVVTNENGCNSLSSEAVTVTMYPLPATPVVAASSPLVFCQGSQVTLTALNEAAHYLWSDGSMGRSITVNNSGDFNLTITDQNGCRSHPSLDISVTVNPLPVQPLIVVSGNRDFCFGSSVTLHAPVGYANYEWSNGTNASYLIADSSGTFSVRVKDQNGCVSPWSVPVSVNELPAFHVNAGNNSIVYYGYADSSCRNLQAVVTGRNSGYGLLWNTGQSSHTIRVCPDQTTNYTVTATDSYGCKATDEVKVCVVDVHCGPSLNKIQVCHKTGSGQRVNLCVAPSAVPAMLAKGDKLGSCSTMVNCVDENFLTYMIKSKDTVNDIVLRKEALFQAWPNPFSATVRISFSLPVTGKGSLRIYNNTGIEVARLFDGDIQKDKIYFADFKPSGNTGGLYLAKLITFRGEVYTQKLISINK